MGELATQIIFYLNNPEDAADLIRRMREAVYELSDDDLIRELEDTVLPLRRLAGGMERQEFGKQCLPQIGAVLQQLAELEVPAGRSKRG